MPLYLGWEQQAADIVIYDILGFVKFYTSSEQEPTELPWLVRSTVPREISSTRIEEYSHWSPSITNMICLPVCMDIGNLMVWIKYQLLSPERIKPATPKILIDTRTVYQLSLQNTFIISYYQFLRSWIVECLFENIIWYSIFWPTYT